MHQFINPRPSIPSSGIVGIDACIFQPIPLSSTRLSSSGRPHRVKAACNNVSIKDLHGVIVHSSPRINDCFHRTPI
ncbi:hypothetical protein DM01DRAFT_1299856 [Hesseltinella vesiculosa]|uniref:Uncharacterized protein n=1 Tax=Hesseltinella vesiculosa TaxID=101127 RepID=A0A1X2GW20_9FUNG|nr:hypothetical protein DM01DRAFT_1299856 [Hesseltinella vesiculosa]